MRKEVLFIYNPSAGKTGANAILPEAVAQLVSDNCRVTAYPVLRGYGAEKILEEENGRFDAVLCCGGDGTLNHTINGLMNLGIEKPQLGYIPSGSTNDFASSMGIKGTVETCRSVAYGQPFYYDIGKFNQSYFNYVAAFGAFTAVSYSTSQDMKNQLGHAAYILEGLRHIPIGKYHTVTVTVNGETFTDNYIYGSVSNTTSIGGMKIDLQSDVEMNDGLFEVLLIKAPQSPMDLQNIVSALLTQNYEGAYLKYFKTDSVRFEFDKETPWTLDGEFGGDVTSAQISVIPKAIGLMK